MRLVFKFKGQSNLMTGHILSELVLKTFIWIQRGQITLFKNIFD